MKLSSRLIVGRILTRSGDQAWDFAVPIILLKLFPNELRVAAVYYLIVRLIVVLILPKLTQLIDRLKRERSIFFGIAMQLIGVLTVYFSFLPLSKSIAFENLSILQLLYFGISIIGGVLGSLGSTFTDISLADDLVPTIFKGEELTRFNSRLRQIDLLTEVTSPVIAGLLLLLGSDSWILLGFTIVMLWNLISFFPEYYLLRKIFIEKPELSYKVVVIDELQRISFFRQLAQGWSAFLKEPAMLVMLAYALLWLSVLSPHGVLLTAFLQDAWKLPEWQIGLFRGSGAIFGLLATLLFPLIVSKTSVQKASLLLLGFQATALLATVYFFNLGNQISIFLFLGFILISRIGLYGFSLGEMQIRQESIGISVRGQVNGFANALTTLATLVLFGLGVLLPSTADFKYLILISVGCVVGAFFMYLKWYMNQRVRLKED